MITPVAGLCHNVLELSAMLERTFKFRPFVGGPHAWMICHHEAAHAVAAYLLGQELWLKRMGVEQQVSPCINCEDRSY